MRAKDRDCEIRVNPKNWLMNKLQVISIELIMVCDLMTGR